MPIGRRTGEAACLGGDGGDRIVSGPDRAAFPAQTRQQLMEGNRPERGTDRAERQEIGSFVRRPAGEGDAQRKAAPRRAQQQVLVDADGFMEGRDRRQRRQCRTEIAYAVTIAVGLDHHHPIAMARQSAGERGGCHPAGDSAAKDRDGGYVVPAHARTAPAEPHRSWR